MSDGHRWETRECPAILVSLGPDAGPHLAHWVQIGAEEEGVPCQIWPGAEQSNDDPLALAHAAAQASRIGVGVGIAQGRIALQEAHMPPNRPVMLWELDDHASDRDFDRRICRLIGSNAGRLVKRMPLRFEDDPPPERPIGAQADKGQSPGLSPPDADTLARLIGQALKRRGWS